jgi:hypothetical protein
MPAILALRGVGWNHELSVPRSRGASASSVFQASSAPLSSGSWTERSRRFSIGSGLDLVSHRASRLHHQMKMVSHQTVGLHPPTGFGARLAQPFQFQESLAIRIVLEDRFPTVAAIHHVVDHDSPAVARPEPCRPALPPRPSKDGAEDRIWQCQVGTAASRQRRLSFRSGGPALCRAWFPGAAPLRRCKTGSRGPI